MPYRWAFGELDFLQIEVGGTLMRKRLIVPDQEQTAPPRDDWLNLEELAEVEITSEDATHTIESALLPDGVAGWRAGGGAKASSTRASTGTQ